MNPLRTFIDKSILSAQIYLDFSLLFLDDPSSKSLRKQLIKINIIGCQLHGSYTSYTISLVLSFEAIDILI